MVNDELMNVSVKIVRGVDKKGIVDIMMESELRGKIAATFQAKEDGIHGLVATDSEETAVYAEVILYPLHRHRILWIRLAERMMMLQNYTVHT